MATREAQVFGVALAATGLGLFVWWLVAKGGGVRVTSVEWYEPQPFEPGTYQPAIITIRNNTDQALVCTVETNVGGRVTPSPTQVVLGHGLELGVYVDVPMPLEPGQYDLVVSVWAEGRRVFWGKVGTVVVG